MSFFFYSGSRLPGNFARKMQLENMKEIDPMKTSRAYAYDMWKDAPMPMVTLLKRMEVSRLRRVSKRKRLKFNMLMCWCIGRAASRMREFYLLPVGRKLIQYQCIAVCTIVKDREGQLRSCDVPYSADLWKFNADYVRLTEEVVQSGKDHNLEDYMVIGTSALIHSEIDGAVGMYSGIYNNPFLIWGRYRRQLLRQTLMVSFQFHHVQMDGAHAALFLERLQKEIKSL